MRYLCRWTVLVAVLVIISLVLLSVDATLSKSDKKNKQTKKKKSGQQNVIIRNVIDRGLVQAEHHANSIVKEHSRYAELEKEVRRFDGSVLAYVTPWNSKGYDIAKTFNKKFTLISPVWLQVTPKANNDFEMTGGHDIDREWAAEVSRGGLLVPRVLFDRWSITDYQRMFSSEQLMGKCAKTITTFIKKHGFGGLTIEIWNQVLPELQSDMIHFLIDLSDMLHKANKIIILVIPPLNLTPVNRSPRFNQEHFKELKSFVDYFNVMTYDYHIQSGVAGPTSPVEWIEQSIRGICPKDNVKDRSKILLGINFFGIKYGEYSGAQPVIGHEFINILKTRSPQVSWQPKDAEHLYTYKEESNGEPSYIFFPSLLFIQERINLARKLGTGIGIWEIGQGLDYFYDLL